MILKKRIHCKDWVLKLCTFDKENYYIMHVWKGELCWNYVHLIRKIITLCTFGKENCAEITYIFIILCTFGKGKLHTSGKENFKYKIVVFTSFLYANSKTSINSFTKNYDIRDVLNHLKIKQQYNEYVIKNNIL